MLDSWIDVLMVAVFNVTLEIHRYQAANQSYGPKSTVKVSTLQISESKLAGQFGGFPKSGSKRHG